MKAAQKMHQHLAEVVFPGLTVGLLHGRLPADEKEAVMDRFKRGEVKILVSTTVIEVGVDVPNATVMVIEQAERFGLAQLHQLRGRVGRGAAQSYCILVTEKLSQTAQERIRTLVDSTDGFYIAEMDLKLRGPGEFFGTRQSGLPALRIANIMRDAEMLELARSEAIELCLRPPSPKEFTPRRRLSSRPLAAPLRPGGGGLMRVIGGEFRSRRLKSLSRRGAAAHARPPARGAVQRAGSAHGRLHVPGRLRRLRGRGHRGAQPRRRARDLHREAPPRRPRDRGEPQIAGSGDRALVICGRALAHLGRLRPALCSSIRPTSWSGNTARRSSC